MVSQIVLMHQSCIVLCVGCRAAMTTSLVLMPTYDWTGVAVCSAS